MNFNLSKIIEDIFSKKIYFYLFCALFICLLITRLYDLEGKSVFGYDQVDNAWAIKNIIIDGKLPMVGTQVKGNTGFFIGPLYYYYLVPFYLLSNLDPIASGFAAVFASIFSFIVIFYVSRKIFNVKVALIALFITTFSSYIITLDRTQWHVNFMVPITFLIFYSLYQISKGKIGYTFLLIVSLGVSLHVHFTSILYFLLIIMIYPFLPNKTKIAKKIFVLFPIFLLLSLPIILSLFKTDSGGHAVTYLSGSFHGFHLRRFIQIAGDGFIEFNSIVNFKYNILISITSFTVYLYLVFHSKFKKQKVLVFMSLIWVLVPWIVFSTYSGELTNYYFGITRVVALLTFSYLIYCIFELRKPYSGMLIFLFLFVYAAVNIKSFIDTGPVGLKKLRAEVKIKIQKGEKIEFVQGDPKSYLYYLYERNSLK